MKDEMGRKKTNKIKITQKKSTLLFDINAYDLPRVNKFKIFG